MTHTRPTRRADRFARLSPTDLTETETASVVRLALKVLAKRYARGEPLSSTKDTEAYLQLRLAQYKNEVFCALFLDNRHRVLCFEELFQGTIDGTSVHPRVVAQRALELNAAAVIFVHNHRAP